MTSTLKEMALCTIDGKTAKDFDDAISLEKKPEGGWRLGVELDLDVLDFQHVVLVVRRASSRG